ncbi:ArdC family protein [Pleomorphovibrio marinus]|uniref:ArdC family protein n=1 Tax=Pleomorphovibrio marinus TaxID=2164132 RepID=UPI000E0A21BF|nr:zincin-like metallopeptidase domain-containing protein [Pleomorphovibrio marinus]
MAAKTQKMYEAVAEKIIAQLKEGTAPWQQPWEKSTSVFEKPFNAVTNQAYRGLNSLYLQLFSPFEDPRWATFKQAQSQGWQVQKGAKGMAINFVKTHQYLPKRDERGKPVVDQTGKPVTVRKVLNPPIVTKAWVFNAEQIKGVSPLEKSKEVSQWEKLARVENLIKNTRASITHIQGNKAYYSPLGDNIRMPERTQFKSSDRYYATLLHELGHWTGHKDRLDRSIMNTFGSREYAREELRAEIASMMMGAELRIGHDPNQHVAYVESWIKLLTAKPFEIHQAAADSQKIMDYLMAFDRKRELKQDDARSVVPEKVDQVPQQELEPTLKFGR